jgi:HAD superfamily hydrolase (TIGR01450 family)
LSNPFLVNQPPPGNVVFDVDGCLTFAGQAIPGAAECLEAVASVDARIVIATNNATKTPEAVATQVSEVVGYPIAAGQVVTSAMAAASYLSEADSPVYVVGEDGVHSALAQVGLETTTDPPVARSVIVGLDRSFDYTAMTAATIAVGHGARLVACNSDASFPSKGVDVPGSGAILASIETATGTSAVVAGKPHDPMIDLVRSRLGPGPTWMVGDRPETDMLFGRNAGWLSLLVLTGIVRDTTQVPENLKPDAVLGSVAEIAEALAQ